MVVVGPVFDAETAAPLVATPAASLEPVIVA